MEDILSKPIWGLYSANPAAKFLKIEIQLGSSTFECQTVTKANKIAGNLLTSMVFITCPAPSQLIEGGEARHHLIVRSNPSRGDSIVPLCAWNQHQVPISNVSADIEFPTLAICVRPFRPYFFGTTMPSISKEQVSAWVKHHLAEGIDRIYLYDYYEAGDGLGDPTLKNYLEASDIPVDIGPRAADERVNIRRMRFLSDKTSTFDALITKSYIYDQMPVMEQCFMQARREGISHVLHIDFDEYMHYRPTNETFSIKSALSVAGKLCTDWDFSLDQTKIKGVVSGSSHPVDSPKQQVA